MPDCHSLFRRPGASGPINYATKSCLLLLIRSYGEIFTEMCTKLKAQAEARRLDDWQMVQRHYWTEIDANIHHEEDAYHHVLSG